VEWCLLAQRIYVGNLPFSAREEEVRNLFAAYGEVVTVVLPTDRETGRPRGFGFVEMSNEDAQKAIDALNGADFGGRALNVNVAREREERRPGGGGGGYGGGGGGSRYGSGGGGNRGGGGGGYGGGGRGGDRY
jgi:cold-inducible RNA-binding protein